MSEQQHEAFMQTIVQSLVKLYADENHEGHIPEDREAFITEITEAYYATADRHRFGSTTEDWLRMREELARYLRTAIELEELCRKPNFKN